MTNVFTKKSHYPMTTHLNDYRAFDSTHPLFKRIEELSVSTETEEEMKKKAEDFDKDVQLPKLQYTLDTIYRIAYQKPQYHPDMPDDVKHARTAYSPIETSAVGILPGLYPSKYSTVPGAGH